MTHDGLSHEERLAEIKRHQQEQDRRTAIKLAITEKANYDPGFALAFAMLELATHLDDIGDTLARIADEIETSTP